MSRPVDPSIAAQLHAQERARQASLDAGLDRAAIDAAAGTADREDWEVEGGHGSVDE